MTGASPMRRGDRMRTRCLVLSAFAVAFTASACTSSPGSEPRPGDVFIDGAPAPADIAFYFPPGTDADEVEDEVTGVLRDLGLDGDAEVDVEGEGNEPVQAEVDVEVIERTGFMSFAVEEAVLRGLRNRRVLVQTPVAATVESEVQRVAHNPMDQTYEVESSEFAYRVSWIYHSLLLLALIGVTLAPYPVARRYVAALRRKELEAAVKVHRLRRFSSLSMNLGLVIATAATTLTGVVMAPEVLVTGLIEPGIVTEPLLAVVYVGLVVAFVRVVGSVTQPYYRELREIKATRGELRRRAWRAGLVMTLFPITWVVVINLFDSAPMGAVLRLMLLVVVLAFGPLVIRLALGSSDMDPTLRQKLIDFARDQGLRVRDIRALKGRPEKHGNAVVGGLLPRFKYIFLTDYLIDELSEDELLAVVAHEIGHAKRHHLLIKFLVPFLFIVPIVILFVVLNALDVEVAAAIPAITLPLFIFIGLMVLQGTIGQRLEKSADDYACDVVGIDATTRALEKLAEMNMTPRRTGRLFNLLTQHPAIEDRIQRLRERPRVEQGATA